MARPSGRRPDFVWRGDCVLALVVTLSVMACRTDQLVEPTETDEPPRDASLAVYSSEQDCATITVQIGSNDQVTATFPPLSACNYGLMLLSGGAPTYKKTGRLLTVPVAVKNGGPDTGQPPIRVVLPRDSAVITAPTNVSGAVSVTNADSTAPGGSPDAGATFWQLSNTPLEPGQSTGPRILTFSLPAKATGMRFGFTVRAELPDTARPAMPSRWAEQLDPAITVPFPTNPNVRYFRHRFILAFDPAASGDQVRSVLSRYGATVVGGVPEFKPRGAYIVGVPDPGPDPVAWKALYDNVAAEPAVQLVVGMEAGSRLEPRARYPNDGPGRSQGDWIARSSSIEPWLAIRAPQAWGCETGTYSNARLKVGVIDNLFESQHGDFLMSTVRSVLPGNPVPNSFGWADAVVRGHGTMVTSLFVARGDDGIGSAGMLWGADIALYGFSKGTDYSQVAPRDLFSHVQDAAGSGVRVLLLAAGMGNITDGNVQQFLEQGFEDYLSTGGYVVLASGNDGRSMPLTSLQTSQDTTFKATDAVLARLHDQYPHQVYFVPAIDRSGGLRSTSNFWSGGVKVAAPGETIRVRAPTAEFPSGYRDGSGSSYAAPFVAGLIGQLLSMDPSLTPADVHHYLTQGALEVRRDSLTGGSITPQPVTNAPSTVYQIDAYGSLSLLARERSNVPVCGYSVAEPTTPPNNAILLERLGDTVRVTLEGFDPNFALISYPSLASGGRALAVTLRAGDLLGGRIGVFSPQGQRLQTLYGSPFWRTYFASGTADFYENQGIVGADTGRKLNYSIARADGSSYSGVLRDDTGQLALWPRNAGGREDKVAVSPDGKYILFVHRYMVGETSIRVAQFAQPVAGGPTQSLGSTVFPCPLSGACLGFDQTVRAAWSPSGLYALLAWRGNIWRYRVTYNASGPWSFALSSSIADDYQALGAFYVTPDEAVLKYAATLNGSCFTVERPLGNLAVTLTGPCNASRTELLRAGK